MSRALVLLVALAALVPATAQAREVSGGPAGTDRGLRVGERAFGVPACGRPVVAYATFAGPHLLSGADEGRCRILVNADLAGDMPRAMVCTLVAHEWGHLAGRPHARDRRSVMYADYVGPDERCVSTRARARRASGTPPHRG
jgi:hypothetical protein